ncbi:hypothetical protein LIA77_10441 [Sarocladium implicatum]|nr:hypothetical protein LIA77_10441 [Sarocladium implicatum]
MNQPFGYGRIPQMGSDVGALPQAHASLPPGYATMRVKNGARMSKSNVGKSMVLDQGWKGPAVWQAFDGAQGPPQGPAMPPMTATRSSSMSSQFPPPPFASYSETQAGLESMPRPLPYPPVSGFPQSPAINLSSTFERMSWANPSAKRMPQLPMAYPAQAQPNDGSSMPCFLGANAPYVQPIAYPDGSVNVSGSAPDVKEVAHSRKQAVIRGSSWRRSDDARNYIGQRSQDQCPNGGSLAYQPCTCDKCKARNRSVFVHVLSFKGVAEVESIISRLKSGLGQRVGQVAAVHPAGHKTISAFLVQ